MRSFFVVRSLIIGGWIIATSAMYVYAQTAVIPRISGATFAEVYIVVGPSAPPIHCEDANDDQIAKKMSPIGSAPRILQVFEVLEDRNHIVPIDLSHRVLSLPKKAACVESTMITRNRFTTLAHLAQSARRP